MRDYLCIFCGLKGHSNAKCRDRNDYNAARAGEPAWAPPQEIIQLLRDRRAAQEPLPPPPAKSGTKHPGGGRREDDGAKRARHGSGNA